MKLLLDNNLSPRLADTLSAHGWDVVHVRSLGLAAATEVALTENTIRIHRLPLG